MKKFNDLVNDLGRLQEKAVPFVNDSFTKEVKELLSFAKTRNEEQIIASILKSIIADTVSKM